MALTKIQKEKILDDIQDKVDRQRVMIFVDFTGVKVKDLAGLRKKLKEVGGNLKVVKKTLLKLVFEKKGLQLDIKNLKGELAVAFGFQDEVAPAKAVFQVSRANENLKILGGFLEDKAREAEEILTLAQLPARDVLLATLTRSMASPISGLVNVLQGNLKGLIFALSAISKSK